MSARELEILRQIGRGGHGSVYLARSTGGRGFERLVALKVVRQDARVGKPEDLLIHEARLLGLLRHRSIVVAEDIIDHELGLALVMEYVPGVDLSDVLRLNQDDPGVASVGWLAHVGFEVSSALRAAWTSPSPLNGKPLRALHCDVKPGNVRVTPHGQVKLLDFGVSHSELADEERMLGTASYAAPERFETGRPSPAGDLFSLGLSLLAVARGQGMQGRPLDAEAHRVWAERALGPLEAGPYAPLVPLLRSLIHEDPQLRPQHDEARARFFELLRTHGLTPPSERSAHLVELAQAQEFQGTGLGPSPTVADRVPSPPPAFGVITLADEFDFDDGETTSSLERTEPGAEHGVGDPGGGAPPPQLGPTSLGPSSEPTLIAHDGFEDETVGGRPELVPPPPGGFERLLTTWFQRGAGARVGPVHSGGATRGHAFRLFGACSIFQGWFTVEAAQVVLGPYVLQEEVTLPDALDHLLGSGALEARPADGVPLFRLREGRTREALAVVAPWPARERLALVERYGQYLLAQVTDARLEEVCQGMGPGTTLLASMADDLDRLAQVPAFAHRGACLLGATVLRHHLKRVPPGLESSFAPVHALAQPAAPLEVRALRWEGQLRADRLEGDREANLHRVDSALDAARAAKDEVSEAALWQQRGCWLLALGESEEALQAHQLALEMSRRQEDVLRTAVCAERLAQALRRVGREDEALSQASLAEQTCAELGAARLHGRVLAALANQARERGDLSRAQRLSTRAVYAARRRGGGAELPRALVCRALLALQGGDPETAASDLAEAVQACDPSFGLQQTWTAAWLSGALLLAGRTGDAAAVLSRVPRGELAVFGDTAVVLFAWRARLALAQGRAPDAEGALQAAEAARSADAGLRTPTVEALLEETRAAVVQERGAR